MRHLRSLHCRFCAECGGKSGGATSETRHAQDQQLTGAKGQMKAEEGVFKVFMSRTDVELTVDGTPGTERGGDGRVGTPAPAGTPHEEPYLGFAVGRITDVGGHCKRDVGPQPRHGGRAPPRLTSSRPERVHLPAVQLWPARGQGRARLAHRTSRRTGLEMVSGARGMWQALFRQRFALRRRGDRRRNWRRRDLRLPRDQHDVPRGRRHAPSWASCDGVRRTSSHKLVSACPATAQAGEGAVRRVRLRPPRKHRPLPRVRSRVCISGRPCLQ